MNRLRGLPGVLLLRSLLVVILVAIMVALFLDRSEKLSRQVRQTAQQQTLARINAALALYLLQQASEGHLQQISARDGANPFDLLAGNGGLTAPDYRGIGSADDPPLREGWYYDSHRGVIFYSEGEGGRSGLWRLSLRFDDRNGNGRFDPGVDSITGLGMSRVNG